MGAAAALPPRDRRQELKAELDQLQERSLEDHRQLAGLAVRLGEQLAVLEAWLRELSAPTSAWWRVPQGTRTRLECFVCDGAYNLRLALAELETGKAAIVGQFAERDEELTRELYALLGYSAEQIEAAFQEAPDPAAQDRLERAALAERKRHEATCPHGRRLSDWRNPCEECAADRAEAIAKDEMRGLMAILQAGRGR